MLWFLNSIDFSSLEDPILDVSMLIQQIEEIPKDHSLYLNNATEIENYANFFLNEKSDDVEIETRDAIFEYNKGNFTKHIDPIYIPLKPFTNNIKPDPFYSTLNFFDCLKEISFALNKSSNKHKLLKESLIKINDLLPASVYIPFSTADARNSCVLHIPVSESLIFSTKDRAPFKISIEVFTPAEEYELSGAIQRVNYKHTVLSDNSSTNEISAEVRKEIFENKENKYLRNEQDSFQASDCMSLSNFVDTDNNDAFVSENFIDQQERIKSASIYGNLKT